VFSSNVQPKRRIRARPTAAAREDRALLQGWEDEGGHQSTDDDPDVETDHGKRATGGLRWPEFLRRFFPGRRRHDLEALQAYAAYRSESTPATPRASSQPLAAAEESRKGARS
jgi:hypothetical protein